MWGGQPSLKVSGGNHVSQQKRKSDFVFNTSAASRQNKEMPLRVYYILYQRTNLACHLLSVGYPGASSSLQFCRLRRGLIKEGSRQERNDRRKCSGLSALAIDGRLAQAWTCVTPAGPCVVGRHWQLLMVTSGLASAYHETMDAVASQAQGCRKYWAACRWEDQRTLTLKVLSTHGR